MRGCAEHCLLGVALRTRTDVRVTDGVVAGGCQGYTNSQASLAGIDLGEWTKGLRARAATTKAPVPGLGLVGTPPDECLRRNCTSFVQSDSHEIRDGFFRQVDPRKGFCHRELAAGIIVGSVSGVLQPGERRYELLYWR